MALNNEEAIKHLIQIHAGTAQAYHELAHLIRSDKHTAKLWRYCTEPTCQANLAALRVVMDDRTEQLPSFVENN